MFALTRTAPSSSVLTWTGSRHGRGDPFDAERGVQIGGVTGAGLDAGHLHADRRIALGVEEVGRSQVLVAFADAGAQRCHLDVETAEDGALAGDLAVGVDVGEPPFDTDQAPEVLDAEADG